MMFISVNDLALLMCALRIFLLRGKKLQRLFLALHMHIIQMMGFSCDLASPTHGTRTKESMKRHKSVGENMNIFLHFMSLNYLHVRDGLP